MKRRVLGLILALVLALCCMALPALAEDWSDLYSFSDESAIGYDAALEAYQAYPAAPEGTRIELLPSAAVLTGDAALAANVEGAAEALVLGDGESTVTWTVEVPVTGLYELEIAYFAQEGNEAKIQRKLTIDGAVPYEEANNLCLYRRFEEVASGIGRKNSINDEVWPKQTEIRLWQTVRAADGQGVYVDPLRFYLTQGTHEIALHYVDQPVTFGTLAFVSPAEYPTYAEVAATSPPARTCRSSSRAKTAPGAVKTSSAANPMPTPRPSPAPAQTAC